MTQERARLRVLLVFDETISMASVVMVSVQLMAEGCQGHQQAGPSALVSQGAEVVRIVPAGRVIQSKRAYGATSSGKIRSIVVFF